MHGIVFFLLQRFVENELGQHGWRGLFEASGLPPKRYAPAHAHPDTDFLALVQAAAAASGRSPGGLLEAFGTYVGPELLALHARLIRPEWRTLDIVANAEEVIHTVVRAKNPEAKPPVLRTQRRGDDEVELVYSSERHACALAKGMVQGLARHFGEEVEIIEDSCMLHGDPFCSMAFRRTAAAPLREESKHGETVADFRVSDRVTQSRPGEVAGPVPTLEARPRDDGSKWFGTYRVRGLLGRGGMGEVFQAEDPALMRDVAIKTLRPDFASDSESRRRFVLEARTMASVHHQRIVPIYHVGHDDGIPYLVMPLLRGQDLAAWLREGNRATVEQAQRIAQETTAALAAAHAANIVHRDIKPNNIWLEAPNGHVRLMDFGLCRVYDEFAHDGTRSVVGTPYYMAPECFDGEADVRSDLYAVGAVLYELLTGEPPFREEGASRLMKQIVTEPPRPPSTLREDVPDHLDDIVLRLLAKDPDDRPQTADELALALA